MGETCNSQQPSSIQKIVPTVQKSLLCAMMLTTASLSAQTEIEPDALSVNPSYDITHALQDRLAGVEIQNIGNQAGAQWDIVIRGLKTISGGDSPLLVINGVPSSLPLSSLDLQDIASIEVLKDAATTAIYGSRGKNGVIRITTKSGEYNQDVKVSYDGYFGTRKVWGRYPLRTAQELLDLREEMGYRNLIFSEPNSDGYIEKADNDIDWQDRLFETGQVSNHNVNASGGWGTGSFNLNLGYVKDEGVMPEEDYKRLNASLKVRQQVGSYIYLGFNTRLSNQKWTKNQMNVAQYISQSPLVERTKEEDEEDRTGMAYDYESKNLDLGVRVAALCPWVDGLQYIFDADYLTQENIRPLSRSVVSFGDKDPRTHIRHYQHNIQFNRTWADRHNLSLLGQLLTTKQRVRQDAYSYYWKERPDNTYTSPQTITDDSDNTLSFRFKYGYDDRYEVSAAVSKDWFSIKKTSRDAEKTKADVVQDMDGEHTRFAKSVHVQWNAHNEKFLSEANWLSALSLRYDCGKIYSPVIYSYLSDPSDWSSKVVYDFYQQRHYSSNFGLDFSLWEGRLSGSVDYYEQKIYNQRIFLTYDNSSTTATVRNKGWEFALQGTIIDHWNGWTWSVGANLYANRNELTEWDDRFERQNFIKGYPLHTPCRYVYEGIWQENDPDRDKSLMYWQPGSLKYKEEIQYDEKGNIRNSDYLFPVSREPKMKGGFNTHLAWRCIDLDVVGAFQVGGKVFCNWFDQISYAPWDYDGHENSLMLSDYWTPENTDARYPSIKTYARNFVHCLGWYDASMCKIRSITLGYNAEGEWLNKCHVSKLRLYATVQNPFVFGSDFYKEFKMDPETNQSEYTSTRYSERCYFPVIGVQAPSTRNYIVGVNLEF